MRFVIADANCRYNIISVSDSLLFGKTRSACAEIFGKLHNTRSEAPAVCGIFTRKCFCKASCGDVGG